MLVGIALIAVTFGTLDFERVFGAAGTTISSGTATAIALLLFAGAIGKSAQVPLHVWLPDAMAGPTPVSALIHAATMVTAGVYLVVRSQVIFELSPIALPIVLVVGLVTMLFAGICAVAQWDIKRVLAYSTSQPARLHVHGGRDARVRGRDVLPRLPRVLQGADVPGGGLRDPRGPRRAGHAADGRPAQADADHLRDLHDRGALPGRDPPLAGFFAKDAVLEVANHTGRQAVFVLGAVGAFVTAFYLGRMVILTFFGRGRSEAASHAHESRGLLLVPLAVLGVGAAVVGILNLSPEGRYSLLLEPVDGGGPRR